MIHYLKIFLALSLLVLLAPLAVADDQLIERHAFVVGNSDYPGSRALANPVNDATDMAEILSRLGYKVYRDGPLLDLTIDEFQERFIEFTRQIKPGSVSLVYFAGHGAAYEQDNYLIQVDTNVKWQHQLPNRSIGLRSLVKELEEFNRGGFNIVLLDACRDNPLPVRSFSGGLTQITGGIPDGTFIGYAASHGQVAKDGLGQRNGVYTGELLSVLREAPTLPIEQVHKQVAKRVKGITNNEQVPIYNPNFTGEYCFAPCTGVPFDDTRKKRVITEEPKINPWMIVVGAAVIGAVVLSAGSDNLSESDGFTVVVDPPDSVNQ